jgi:hypothetical protein
MHLKINKHALLDSSSCVCEREEICIEIKALFDLMSFKN